MNGLQLVVFDLAGTMIEDAGHVAHAFVTALAEHGIEIAAEGLQRVRGASKRQAMAQVVPEGAGRDRRAAAAYASFRDHLSDRLRTHGIRPIDGAEQIAGNSAC